MYAWNSQFEKPAAAALIGDLDTEIQSLYQGLRRSMVRSLSAKPKLEWLGLTLGWCETIVPEDSTLLHTVHLVADPENPRVEIALSTAFFEAHPPATLPKQLHTGLSTATCIGHQAWCCWPINSEDGAEAILKIVTLANGS